MRSSHRNVRETIHVKRQWHTLPDPAAAKLGFRGWHSRGYLPHFDMPGVIQMLNYRLDDAMPANRRHEWLALLDIKDELKRRTKIEDYLGFFADSQARDCLRDQRQSFAVLSVVLDQLLLQILGH